MSWHAALTLQELAEAWGVLIYQRQPQGDLFVSIAPVGQTGAPLPLQASQVLSPEFPALWSSEDVLSLDFETAKQLQNELAQLVGRYRHKTLPRSGGYFLLLGLAPVIKNMPQT